VCRPVTSRDPRVPFHALQLRVDHIVWERGNWPPHNGMSSKNTATAMPRLVIQETLAPQRTFIFVTLSPRDQQRPAGCRTFSYSSNRTVKRFDWPWDGFSDVAWRAFWNNYRFVRPSVRIANLWHGVIERVSEFVARIVAVSPTNVSA